jgi:hypothetical protein
LVPDYADRLGLVQAEKKDARSTFPPKIPTLLDSVSAPTFDSFLNIVGSIEMGHRLVREHETLNVIELSAVHRQLQAG